MKTVELAEATHSDLTLLAQAWQVDHNGAVERLISDFRSNGPRAKVGPPPQPTDQGLVEIYADYNGVRVSGVYDPKTQSVRITSGISNQRTFKSPSGAAIAVVSELNPTVDPNRNGWSFWNLVESGETLQQIRRR
jgi:hypothetical protein